MCRTAENASDSAESPTVEQGSVKDFYLWSSYHHSKVEERLSRSETSPYTNVVCTPNNYIISRLRNLNQPLPVYPQYSNRNAPNEPIGNY